ncbi:M1 family aminopeptidase [Bryobacter aggregatus]|uniref:M1 family aminopeptidase n=1 Tax=Bryobacter aggregatus TaxID=360054 RepID=UPI0004E0FDCF|nr:M1 family aminopeptidase [Bryobacter aggregatus]
MKKLRLLPILLLSASLFAQQDRKGRIDVEHYDIDAEILPTTQTLKAKVKMRFVPLDDRLSTIQLDFNDAMRIGAITDDSGANINISKTTDFNYRLIFPVPLAKGKPVTLTFDYDGKFDGREESPVYGIRFAAIEASGAAMLYPSRWFPINEYTSDRYTMNLNVTVPADFRVLSSGVDLKSDAAGRAKYSFQMTQPALYGSFAVVKGNAERVSSEGVTSTVWFKNLAMAKPTGEMVAKAMNFLSDLNGRPPAVNLTLVETFKGFPNGYSAPGILFFSPSGIGSEPNTRLIVNQVSRQWWGGLISPLSRNHIWIVNGLARYSESLYFESTGGASAVELEMRDVYVEALTQPEPPLIQSSRYEDYSPEFWAATAGKGSAVLNMLRNIVGKDQFAEILKRLTKEFAYKQVSTNDFRKVAEQVYGQDLNYFFIQWIESSGAPEFKLSYTVFRTAKGFRVLGKVSQDLDTFRMPVRLKIETEGNPEEKTVEVVGTSSEFSVETFGKPISVKLDPDMQVLRYDDKIRVSVAIRKGEQFAEVSDFDEAMKEYQKALEVNRNSSLAHYRVAEINFLRNSYQAAANEFREVLNGDIEPKWTEVWTHIHLGKIFDVTGQRERAVSEYNQAIRTKDNTQGALEEAAKYVKEPYKRQNVDR